MKKLFLVFILICFLAVPGSAMNPAFLQMVSGGSVICDDCSGPLKFAWHMEDNDSTPDVTLGNPCGCSDGDTIGAETGSPVFSTTQKSDGTYSLHINALAEDYQFDVAGDNLIEPDNVKITFDLYIVSYPANPGEETEWMRSRFDADNYLVARLANIAGTNYLQAKYRGQATDDYVAIEVGTGAWKTSCEYQAKTGVAGDDHYLTCDGNTDEDDDDLVAFADSATYLKFGDLSGDGVGEYYLDNVKIYPNDRH